MSEPQFGLQPSQKKRAGFAMPPRAAPQSGLQRASGHCRGSREDTGSAYLCQSCRRSPGGDWASTCTPRRPSHPGSSCPGARRARARESLLLPLLGLLFASPKLLCALLAEPLQPELAHPAVQGNFGLGRAARRVPGGTGRIAARLPRRWRTTPSAAALSGSRSGSWRRSWKSRRRSRPRARQLPTLRRCRAPE